MALLTIHTSIPSGTKILLKQSINQAFTVMQTSTVLEELSTFLNEAVNVGTEGLIVKTLDSTYEPSRRSAHWLKLKKDYLEGVGDTFDLVPIGAWYGK